MKKYIILIAVVFAFMGCTDPVKEYYVEQSAVDPDSSQAKTILEYLSADSDYSMFVDLLEQASYADTMKSEYLYTVFAPTNEALTDLGVESWSVDSLKNLLSMHICANPKMTSIFEYTSRLLMFSDKYLSLDTDEMTGEYSVDGANLVDYDILCKDGVIHKLDGALEYRMTIYEWVQNLGDEYSMFVDALNESSIYIFDEENSVQIGETTLGRPIYDSVFIVYNTVLLYGDFSDEEAQYRFIIPSNDVISETFAAMADTYIVRGMPVTAADSTEWLNWYLETSTFDYSESGIEYFADLDTIAEFSVFGNEFRPSTVTLSEPIRFSNGFGYTIEEGYLPAYIPMEECAVNPCLVRRVYYYRADALGGYNSGQSMRYYVDGTDYDGWSGVVSEWWNAGVWLSSSSFLQIHMRSDATNNYQGYVNGEAYYYWKTCDPSDYSNGNCYDVEMVPGNYILTGKVSQAWDMDGELICSNDYHEIYVNGDLIDILQGVPLGNYNDYSIFGDPNGFYVGDSIKMATFKILVREGDAYQTEPETGLGYEGALRMSTFTLTPYNNY